MSTLVIFLDIDGVLVNLDALRAGTRAHPACVGALNHITNMTGAGLVITSNRRLGASRAALEELLRSWGVQGAIYGATPPLGTSNGTVWRGVARGEEIQAWLNANPGVSGFVILDDCADMVHLMGALVQTDPVEGLTMRHAKAAIVHLRREVTA